MKQRFRTYRSAVELLRQSPPSSLVVIDRSVWSDWVFARQAYADGFISAADFDWYLRLRARIAERVPIAQCPFAVVYLDVTPEECHHRVHHVRRRPFESGISLDYLRGLDRFYGEFLVDMQQRGAPVLRFDWNAYGNVDTVIDAVKQLR